MNHESLDDPMKSKSFVKAVDIGVVGVLVAGQFLDSARGFRRPILEKLDDDGPQPVDRVDIAVVIVVDVLPNEDFDRVVSRGNITGQLRTSAGGGVGQRIGIGIGTIQREMERPAGKHRDFGRKAGQCRRRVQDDTILQWLQPASSPHPVRRKTLSRAILGQHFSQPITFSRIINHRGSFQRCSEVTIMKRVSCEESPSLVPSPRRSTPCDK